MTEASQGVSLVAVAKLDSARFSLIGRNRCELKIISQFVVLDTIDIFCSILVFFSHKNLT